MRRYVDHVLALLPFDRAAAPQPAYGGEASAGAATTSYYSYSKLPSDLTQAIDSGTTPSGSNWSSTVNGVPMVQVLIVGNGSDPDMVSLRAAVVANGGSVFARYYAVSALSAMLPLDKVATIAAREMRTKRCGSRRASRLAMVSRNRCGLPPA
mgnify:CR=1 FL=1